ncbi:hypothetical protein [Natronococcus occultus]|uniref:Uncharacterized protein n=1 Tax=Natronococcus occultus SP4 TaxID=694430 RepID=L0JZG4_9EURY|nr:hypothetical protein [Natronococcus occultus]AGB37489.1 hypothetical protein Natoc_1684 [Natronococcus occultus SP4]
MSSSFPSRRQLLAAGSCLPAVLAGCAGPGESSTTHNTTDGGEPMASDEYDSLTLRADDDVVFVYPNDDPPDETDESRSRPRRNVEFVLSRSAAEDLRIDADGIEDARAFLEETDFETESVVVEQRPIEDCYRRHVLGVRAEADEFRTRYCRTLRSPTTPCEADRTVMEAIFLRIRRSYDDRPSSRGSSESGSCPESALETGENAIDVEVTGR